MSGKKRPPVLSRYCDEPMARHKGLIGNRKPQNQTLKSCNNRCNECICCIEVLDDGNRTREHVDLTRKRND